MRQSTSTKLILFLFMLPAILFFSIIVIYPITQSIYGSMLDWDGISNGSWLGLGNYKKLFQSDLFWLSQKNTMIYLLVSFLYSLIIGFGAAVLLISVRSKLNGLFRSSFFLPVVISSTVVCQMWLSILNYDSGLVNSLFRALGLDYRQEWLTSSATAIITVAFVNAWQYMGLTFMMFYTNIRSIPEEYFEAARIDGATTVQIHRHITLPLLQEAFRFTVISSVSGALRAFDSVYIMTNGGPGDYSHTLTFLLYKTAFMQGKYGYGSAVAVVIVLESLLFFFIINKTINKRDVYA